DTRGLTFVRGNCAPARARGGRTIPPYPNFVNQPARTVAQALRPFPQYSTISTGPQNGDKSGHLSYHAFILKADRRFSKGLTFQWNYVLSKLITDSDTYFANSATSGMDQYNPRL